MKHEKFSKLIKKRTLQINNILVNLGYETCCYTDDCYEINFKNDLFYARVHPTENIIQFGLKSTFDRWANSVDLSLDLPNRADRFIKMMEKINTDITSMKTA